MAGAGEYAQAVEAHANSSISGRRLVTPDARDPPVHDHRRRQPAGLAVHARLVPGGQQCLDVARQADHVLVERGDERGHAGRLRRRTSSTSRRQQPALLALDVDLHRLVPQRLEHPARPGGRLHAPPAGEVLACGRPVQRQVAPRDLEQRLLRVHGVVRRRGGEADVAALARPVDQPARPRGGLEHGAPALTGLPAGVGVGALLHRGGQLLAREQRAFQRLPHGLDQPLDVVGPQPGGARPGGLEEVVEGRERRLPHAVLVRRQQVQRAAHRPRLDQLAAVEQVLRGGRILDPRRQHRLGRRRHLRVQAAQTADHVHGGGGRRAPHQPVALHAPRRRLFPGQLSQGSGRRR